MLVSFVLNLCDSALLFGFGLPLTGLCARSERPMPRKDQRLMRAVLALRTSWRVVPAAKRDRGGEKRGGEELRTEESHRPHLRETSGLSDS